MTLCKPISRRRFLHDAAGAAAALPLLDALAKSADSQSRKPSNGKLAAMPDNTWLNLKPRGMAYARMYSGCCFGGGHLWYFGGAHRGYKGNDVQLFDPRASEWIQATKPEWPKVGSKDWKSMTSGGGYTSQLSPTGRPFTEHTYQQVCWQPDRQRFFIVLSSSGTWEFDPREKKWIHLINRYRDRSQPRGTWAQNHVLYDPNLKTPVLVCGSKRDGIYKFDHKRKTWQPLADLPRELAWNEFYSTYVPAWKQHLISTMKRGFFQFDLVNRKVTPIASPEALQRCQSLSYDAANGVVIALERKPLTRRTATVDVWALDVKTMKWRDLPASKPRPEGQATGRWAKLWYDPAHNVHLFVNDVKRDL